MKFTKKDVTDIFEAITSSSLVSGNEGSVIASAGLGNIFWASQAAIEFEDGTVDPGIAREDGWED